MTLHHAEIMILFIMTHQYARLWVRILYQYAYLNTKHQYEYLSYESSSHIGTNM